MEILFGLPAIGLMLLYEIIKQMRAKDGKTTHESLFSHDDVFLLTMVTSLATACLISLALNWLTPYQVGTAIIVNIVMTAIAFRPISWVVQKLMA